MNSMLAYPGGPPCRCINGWYSETNWRTARLGPNKIVDLADVRVPVMNIGGTGDVLVPVDVAHHVGDLPPNSPEC